MAKSTSPAASLHYEGWRRRTVNAFKAHWQIYIIILLPIIWYAIFAYLPMGGLQLAF